MLNQKGQESAPFQLLIGIVLVTFVIITGVVLLTESAEQQCNQHVVSTVENLRIEFEDLVKNSASKNIQIRAPDCFDQTAKVDILLERDRKTCSFFCVGSNETCTLLSFSGEKYSEIVCLKIPIQTQFLKAANTACQNKPNDVVPPNYEPINLDFKVPLFTGNYFFTKTNDHLTNVPEICAYKLSNTT
mgnify:CR=1 FL=1